MIPPFLAADSFYYDKPNNTSENFLFIPQTHHVVDFAGEQFIIGLKLWKGEAAHEKAYEQLAGYMGSKGHSTGYLLTFDFRKNVNKQPYAKWVCFDSRKVFDVVL